MPSKKVARAIDRSVGREWRAAQNERHRERTRWVRETFGSDQSIKRGRKRRERQGR